MIHAKQKLDKRNDIKNPKCIKIMRVSAGHKNFNNIIDIKAYGIHDLLEETCLSAKDGIKCLYMNQ